MAFENQLTSITLPEGAGPGEPRIELDGDEGTITLIGTNEDDKIILNPDGPIGTPHINIQSAIAPGDTLAGYGYGTSGPEMLGEEYVSAYNGNLCRSKINQSTFFTDVGQFKSAGGRNGGLLSTGDTHSRLIMYDDTVEMGRVEVTLDTLSGGIRLYAEDLPDPEIRMTSVNYQHNGIEQAQGFRAQVSSTADTAAIGAETAVLTLPSFEFLPAQAYELIIAGRVHKGSIGHGIFRVRRTNAAGTLVWVAGAVACPEVSVDYGYNFRAVLINGTASTVTRTLCLTLTAGAGTIINDGSGDGPRYMELRHVGASVNFQHGIQV